MKSIFIIILTLGCITFTTYGQKSDKLESLRTTKQIVTVDKASAPYYAIQIVALQLPPENAAFFRNVENIREFKCVDGYVRYCVGRYSTFREAAADLDKYISSGYIGSFVSNTRKLVLTGGSKTSGFVPDPNKSYTVQLSAFRFPVYLSYFKGIEGVMEFYMKDKVFRYCVGDFSYAEGIQELAKYKSMGYTDAYVTELDRYLPFQIE